MSPTRSLALIPPLDGVRGIAALMVMVFHFFQAHPFSGSLLSPWLQKATIVGQTGVDLFFVLSGFLITRILIATKHRGNYWSSFYLRRSLRIFPLYFFFLVLFYLLISPVLLGITPHFQLQWWYWCYLQNIPATFPGLEAFGPGHFWSLAVEEHFYLIWPFVVLAVPTSRLATACYVVIGLAMAFRVVLLAAGLGVFYFTPCRMDALAFGALLAVWEQRGSIDQFKKRFYLIAVGLACVLVVTEALIGGQGRTEIQVVKFFFIAGFYACLIGIVRISYQRPIPFLSWRAFRESGRISYGMYVYHPLVLLGLTDLSASTFQSLPMLFTGYLLGTYLVAFASYYTLERPFLKLKELVT